VVDPINQMANEGKYRERLFYSGSSVLALLSFITAFAIARIFTTLFPTTVVVNSGIHFHHFWYGLAMVIVAGWLGIASTNPKYRPVLAIIFGLGGGLIADELGLLLTFGNYGSPLTYPIVMGIIICVILIIMFWHSKDVLVGDLKKIETRDGLIMTGIFTAFLSALPLAENQLPYSLAFVAAGAVVAIIGLSSKKK
jgi:hypothetical protein